MLPDWTTCVSPPSGCVRVTTTTGGLDLRQRGCRGHHSAELKQGGLALKERGSTDRPRKMKSKQKRTFSGQQESSLKEHQNGLF